MVTQNASCLDHDWSDEEKWSMPSDYGVPVLLKFEELPRGWAWLHLFCNKLVQLLFCRPLLTCWAYMVITNFLIRTTLPLSQARVYTNGLLESSTIYMWEANWLEIAYKIHALCCRHQCLEHLISFYDHAQPELEGCACLDRPPELSCFLIHRNSRNRNYR